MDKLTHEEACKLVENSIERAVNTLLYIRDKLNKPCPNGKPRQLSLFDEANIEKANLLCNINWYGAYIKGAKTMYSALKHKGFLDIPSSVKKANEDRITNKAMLDLYMENSRNLEWLLTEVPDSVQMVTSFERNKKGKVIKAKSKFYKKEIIRKEI